MKLTIIALISAFAAVTTAEFCDSGAAGVGACENIDKNTFCVSSRCFFSCLANLTLTLDRHSAWTIRVMHFRLSGTAWRIPRVRLVRAGRGQSVAKDFIYVIRP